MPPKKRTIVSSPGASRRSKRNENKASGTTIDSSVNEMAEASELVIRRGVKNATMPAILEDAGSETLVLPPVQIAAAAAAASAAAAAAASAAAAAAAAKPAAVFVAAEHQDYFSFGKLNHVQCELTLVDSPMCVHTDLVCALTTVNSH